MKYFIISSVIVICAILLWCAVKVKNRNNSMKGNRKYKIFYSLYKKITSIPIIGSTVLNIYSRLYARYPGDKYLLKYRAITYYITSWVVFFVLFTLLMTLLPKDYYMIFVILIICAYMKSVTVDRLIGDDTKLLYELTDFINDVKHNFHMHNMIDVAIKGAYESAPPMMNQHGKLIYDAIDNENSLKNYYDYCQNKYLKIIAGYSFLTKEFGDKKTNEGSLFVKNMNFINDEIRCEIEKRESLNYWFKSLTFLSVVPILFLKLIESWTKYNFPQVKFYYDSGIGIIAVTLILLLTSVCFVSLRYLKNTNDKMIKIKSRNVVWENMFLRFKPIKKIINVIKPKHNTKEYQKVIDLLQQSGSDLQIDWLCIRQLICGVLSLVLFLGFFITYHRANASSILNSNSPDTEISSKAETIKGVMQDTTTTDQDMIKDYIKNKKESDSNDIISDLQRKGITEPEALKDAAIRIKQKLDKYSFEHLRWYEIIISILLSIMFTDVPIWILSIKKAIRKNDMENEVFQFDIIILLLMHHERASVKMILEWMEQFSDIYFNPIRKCLSNMQKGSIEALEQLKADVKYKPFCRIVDNLIMADKIKISDAFDSIENEREFYKDNRKEANRRAVNEKKDIGETLGMIPMYATVLIYMVAPLIWAAYLQLTNLINIFKTN